MTVKNIVYGLTDHPPYEGWDGPNGWRDLFFKDHLQNQEKWVFLYTQNRDVEESIFISYKGQLRAEIVIDGWLGADDDLLKEFSNSLGISKEGRGPKTRGYKVETIRLFEDKEELKNSNLSLDLSKIQFGKAISEEGLQEIREIIDKNYEEFTK